MDNDDKNKSLDFEQELASSLGLNKEEPQKTSPNEHVRPEVAEDPQGNTGTHESSRDSGDEIPNEDTNSSQPHKKNPSEPEYSEEELNAVESMEVHGAPNFETHSLSSDSFTPLGPPRRSKRKQIIIISILTLIAIASIITTIIITINKSNPSAQNTQPIDEVPQITRERATVTSLEGASFKQIAGTEEWKPISLNDVIEEGTSLRTESNGRLTLTIEGRAVIRLDNSSSIKATSLDTTGLTVDHLEGRLYSRVTASDRDYVVTLGGEQYKATGTAFMTIKAEREEGAQVFEGSVVNKVTPIEKGKQHYLKSPNSSLVEAVTDIVVASLNDDSFIKWNASEDAKNETFKDRLGILKDIVTKGESTGAEDQVNNPAVSRDGVSEETDTPDTIDTNASSASPARDAGTSTSRP